MDSSDDDKQPLREAMERHRVKNAGDTPASDTTQDDGVPWLPEHVQQPARPMAPQGAKADEPKTMRDCANEVVSRLKLREITPEDRARWAAEEAERKQRSEAAARRQEYARRESAWNAVKRAMGPKHAGKGLKDFIPYGDDETQDAMRGNLKVINGYCVGMPDTVKSGKNLILTGTKGTGKDHLMAAVLRHAVCQHGVAAKWLYGAQLFLALRGTMVKGAKTTEQDLIRELCEVPILALSDPLPTVGGLTGYQADALLTVVDERYRNERPIYCTLNIQDRADAEARLGALLVDRLFENSLILFSSWPSYRQHIQKQGLGDQEAGAA